MLPIEEINTLVAETGPLDSEILSVSRTGDSAWFIEYEPVFVELEYDVSRGRLLLQTEIGVVPEEKKVPLMTAMLNVSFLWRETGGLHLATAGQEGTAILMVDLAGDELTTESIATVAGNLAERTLIWRAIFASEVKTNEASLSTAPEMEAAFIRV